MFCPEGEDVPEEVGSVRLQLALLPLYEEDDKENGAAGGPEGHPLGAFVSDVGLEASVDWRGAIR